MNRRDFLKKSAIAGGAVAGAAAVGQLVNPKKVSAAGFGVKRHNTIDDVMKINSNYKRFDQVNTAFMATFFVEFGGAPVFEGNDQIQGDYMPMFRLDDPLGMGTFARVTGGYKVDPRVKDKTPGYTQLDYATKYGADALEDITGTAFDRFSGYGSGPCVPQLGFMPLSLYKKYDNNAPGFEKKETVWEFKSKEEAAYIVKKTAKKYGADLVGIAPYDERFVYNSEVFIPVGLDGNPITDPNSPVHVIPNKDIDFGFTPKSVIVLAYEMDYESYKASPSAITRGATGIQYSRMAENSLKVAGFLRSLGYNSLHCGNSTALSVPYAIMAGLGEGSRMGMLITEKYGPRVRIAKVFTDLELKTDKPITFGVKKFCEVCLKCADTCPSGAISRVKKTSDPENKPHNRSNNPGVEKWYNDGQKCFTFWGDNYGDCGNCIAACPYNKIEEWHHDLAKIATKIPGLNSAARYMDEIFGYGKVDNTKAMSDFWKKNI